MCESESLCERKVGPGKSGIQRERTICGYQGTMTDPQPNRTHPADFENPGRVKVQFQKDGKFLNPIIKNRMSLSFFLILHLSPSRSVPCLTTKDVTIMSVADR